MCTPLPPRKRPLLSEHFEQAGEVPPTGMPVNKYVIAREPLRKDAGEHAARVVEILTERGKTHAEGNDDKERSMDNIVSIFKAVSGVELTIEQGWLFMLALKLGRRRAKPGNMDNYHDAMGYLALCAEHKEITK